MPLLFRDEGTSTRRAELAGVAQRHHLGLPAAIGLHDVERGLVEQGVEGPVVAQIMRREVLDPQLAAQHADAFIDGARRERDRFVVAGEERAALAFEVREIDFGGQARVLVHTLHVGAVGLGTIDRDRAAAQVDRLHLEQRDFAAAQSVLHQQPHQQRITRRQEQIVLALRRTFGMRREFLEGEGLRRRKRRRRRLLTPNARGDRLPLSLLIHVSRLSSAIALDREQGHECLFVQHARADGTGTGEAAEDMDRGEAAFDRADGVALLLQPGAQALEQAVAHAAPGLWVVEEGLGGALNAGAVQVGAQALEVVHVAPARIGRPGSVGVGEGVGGGVVIGDLAGDVQRIVVCCRDGAVRSHDGARGVGSRSSVWHRLPPHVVLESKC